MQKVPNRFMIDVQFLEYGSIIELKKMQDFAKCINKKLNV